MIFNKLIDLKIIFKRKSRMLSFGYDLSILLPPPRFHVLKFDPYSEVSGRWELNPVMAFRSGLWERIRVRQGHQGRAPVIELLVALSGEERGQETCTCTYPTLTMRRSTIPRALPARSSPAVAS